MAWFTQFDDSAGRMPPRTWAVRCVWIAFLALAGSAVHADEPTLPVIAVLGDRVLVGEAAAPDANGRSIFKIQTRKGPWIGCEGAFAAYGAGGGPVSAECSNGNKLIGEFRVLSDTSGYGSFPARPDRIPFSFTFGLELKDAVKHIHLPTNLSLVRGTDGVIDLVGRPPS